ncbi:MAG: AMP-binding protein [Coriobacteriales bacterium]|nr:AMP-binding protein [Coriobacteriales bacterium]
MRKTIIEHVAFCAAHNPKKLAMMTPEDSLSYGALYEHARGYAKYLASCGLRRGDIVVLRATQTIEYAIQYLGIHLAGGVVTSLGWTVSDVELVDVAQSVGAAAIIADITLADETCSATPVPLGDVRQIASEHVCDNLELRFPGLADPADILFTRERRGPQRESSCRTGLLSRLRRT